MRPKCLLCTEPAKPLAKLCTKHAEQLHDLMDPDQTGRPDQGVAASIPVLWAKLDPTPGGSAHPDERRPPGFNAAPGANLHTVTMRDERSRRAPQLWYGQDAFGRDDLTKLYSEEPNPPKAVRKELQGIVDQIMDNLNPIGPWLPTGHWFSGREVLALCAHLTYRFQELLTYQHVDQVFLDLMELSDQLRRAIGDAPLKPAGRCIEIVQDPANPQAVRECRGPIELLPPNLDPIGETPEETRERKQKQEVARCPRCHRRYAWVDLIKIRYIEKPDLEKVDA